MSQGFESPSPEPSEAIPRAADSESSGAPRRALFDDAPDAMLVLDPDTGTVLDANPRACELYGYERDDLLGMTLEVPTTRRLSPGADAVTLDQALCHELETVLYRADGRELMLEVSAAVSTHRGRPAILVAQRDVTERRRVQEKRLAEETAKLANRARQEFLSNMSYEIRTPMSSIVGVSELLLQEELPEAAHEYVRIINVAGERLLQALDDVLDFFKVEEAGKLLLETTEFKLRQVLANVYELLSPRASAEGVELGLDLDDAVPGELRGDPARLRQVLIHLVGNAIHLARGKRVVLAVRETRRQGDDLELFFAVHGLDREITPELRARLFAPLGHSYGDEAPDVSQRIIEGMGGEVVLADGAVGFTAGFGRARTGEVAAEARNVPRPRLAGHVLLAEDNPVNRLITQRQLRDLGLRVTAVDNGREALAALTGESFDLVVMDCQMPELDGYEATRRIRQREAAGEHLPVVAVTAHALRGDREKCLEAGMDEYIAKPYREIDLFKILERWLAPGSAEAADGPS